MGGNVKVNGKSDWLDNKGKVQILAFIRQWWKWIVVALVVAGGALLWMGSAAVEVQTTPVVRAYPSQTISVLNATGYVVAQRKASLSSKATGRLEWLGVAEGSVVKAGQMIARIESRDTAAQFEQATAQVGVAQAELTEAQQNFNRSESLLGQKFISPSSHDTAIARLNRSKAALAAAKAAERVAAANLAQSEIRAPFDGVVLTKNANVGDNITPFSSAADTKGAVVTIADMRTLEVEVDVSESNISRLVMGQPVEIALDALPGERFSGVIIRMVPTIDRSKATRLIKLKFDQIDPRVLSDMSAKVVFLERALSPEERQPIVAVSRQAVVDRDGKAVVYRVDNNQLKEVQIGDAQAASAAGSGAAAPGTAIGDLVPTPNLMPGQRVVIRPVNLRDGQRVKVTSP